MTLLNSGQPVGGILQIGYTVADIEKAMASYLDKMKIGPWFVRTIAPKQALYRGKPTELRLTIALAFSGHVMHELIQQLNDVPSVYRELIDKRGYGFHHWGVPSTQFDRDCEAYCRRGFQVALADTTPGSRVTYFDCPGDLPGMVEIIEMDEARERRYTKMYAESLAWDGSNPIRYES